ncbi:MAG: hypothetical protein WBY88_03335 [Desulfosarcina sp.]
MVVGAVINDQGQPICCEMWPGNTTDVKTLLPVIDRLRTPFPIGRLCKPVVLNDHRYIVCLNPGQARKEARIWPDHFGFT